MAAQTQQLVEITLRKNILKLEIESRCRLCKEYEETIDHLRSEFPTLANNEYIMQHHKLWTHLHCPENRKLVLPHT
jgi:hypothetical protein